MAHPAPFNAEPIRLTASQSPGEARNLLIRGVLELNLMPFGHDTAFVIPHPLPFCPSWCGAPACARQGILQTGWEGKASTISKVYVSTRRQEGVLRLFWT